jgi:hypothetical protein
VTGIVFFGVDCTNSVHKHFTAHRLERPLRPSPLNSIAISIVWRTSTKRRELARSLLVNKHLLMRRGRGIIEEGDHETSRSFGGARIIVRLASYDAGKGR